MPTHEHHSSNVMNTVTKRLESGGSVGSCECAVGTHNIMFQQEPECWYSEVDNFLLQFLHTDFVELC